MKIVEFAQKRNPEQITEQLHSLRKTKKNEEKRATHCSEFRNCHDIRYLSSVG